MMKTNQKIKASRKLLRKDLSARAKLSQNMKIKICRTATVAFFVANHLKSQVEFCRDNGFDVTIISSYGPEIHKIDLGAGLKYEELEILRQINLWRDCLALFKLIKIFKDQKFDIVHSTTPKAGLLSSIAAFVTRVPIRLHTWTGQPWVTLKGPKKWLTMFSDRLVGLFCTQCYADSPSQRDFLIDKKIVHPKKIKVLNKGSISGVNLKRFNPDILNKVQKVEIKKEIGLSKDSKIITFIGRMNKDKGIMELISAFKRTLSDNYDIVLLLIGPLDQDSEGEDFVELEEYIKDCPRIHYLGYQESPEKYLAISDIFCLPSYREGFGTTIIEAAAMAVPSVGTKINGLVDAILDGETGILVELKSVKNLIQAFKQLLDNPSLISKMGFLARQQCIKHFDCNVINDLMLKEYLDMLQTK